MKHMSADAHEAASPVRKRNHALLAAIVSEVALWLGVNTLAHGTWAGLGSTGYRLNMNEHQLRLKAASGRCLESRLAKYHTERFSIQAIRSRLQERCFCSKLVELIEFPFWNNWTTYWYGNSPPAPCRFHVFIPCWHELLNCVLAQGISWSIGRFVWDLLVRNSDLSAGECRCKRCSSHSCRQPARTVCCTNACRNEVDGDRESVLCT